MSGSLAWVPKGPALETYETEIRADLEATLANIELPEGARTALSQALHDRKG